MNNVEQGIAAHIGEANLARLREVTIGIAGCGGLGSNCAMHLVRSGFTRFVLVDFDRVEYSNLNRQAFFNDQVGQYKAEALAANMRAVNPDLDLDIYVERVDVARVKKLFGRCDAVVEAFDRAAAKKRLVEALLPLGRLVVSASGIGGCGDGDALATRKVRDNFYLIGDGVTECSLDTPPLSPRVGIAAAKQADVILAHFLGPVNGKEGE
ncbi:Sulfur carrier protein ThiS adenylyltransferase [Pseudodesulfovibrio hydrargyri]|uniref:Sulfur carrier protein ThiS adenylyltransferase n=1 Tax=Pseudodesulfovibrio hydrargyri TaxID=2125990 RepID=A0A1J5NFD1_9BACT|nr:sulfur carrier protein ThiS adenylyltransferase ThiF [Pseudodesulfovibrio hydrargyri]OIQ51927.1 Sulfur carrier protein ThiS adenylyltransferase [Pseudodesulfovibrio hydrargyri]